MKKICILSIIFLLFSCTENNTKKNKIDTPKSNNIKVEKYDNSLKNNKNFIKWLLNTLTDNEKIKKLIKFQILDPDNITLENSSVGLHLKKWQTSIKNGIRSEISIDYPYNQWDIISYEWSIFIPKDFISDAPKNRFWIMWQWHDQPNKNKWEKWKTFPKNSPPIGLYYWLLNWKHSFSLEYLNIKPKIENIIKITKWKWMKIKVNILWSQKSDWYAHVYINDEISPSVVNNGKNMLNNYQHFFKVWLYRDKNINTNNSIYLRDININPIEK